jgi:ABC-type nickel/cobalt efflux system permease component RcnA
MKYFKCLFISVFLFLFFVSVACCADKGYGGKAPDKTINLQKNPSQNTLFRRFAEYQKKGRITIARVMRKLRKTPGVPVYALFWLFVFSFGYGIFHAAGPGHGKAIIVFYLLHCRASIVDALKLVGIIVMTHTGLAILLAFLFHLVFTGIRGVAGITFQNNFTFAGGIIIILIGLFLVVREIKSSDDESRARIAVSKGSMMLMGISAGIVPCPVSLAIMTIALSSGIWYAGFISVFAISLGLAAVLFAVAVCIEKSREGLLRVIASNSRLSKLVSGALSYGGLAAIILLGIFITFFYFPF